jgi:hypothetical protein
MPEAGAIHFINGGQWLAFREDAEARLCSCDAVAGPGIGAFGRVVHRGAIDEMDGSRFRHRNVPYWVL